MYSLMIISEFLQFTPSFLLSFKPDSHSPALQDTVPHLSLLFYLVTNDFSYLCNHGF